MTAREAYFKVHYYLNNENVEVMMFFHFKKNDTIFMGNTQFMKMCKANHEFNIGQLEYIEKLYGKNFLFWSISDEGLQYQKKVTKGKFKPITYLTNSNNFLSKLTEIP